MAREVFVTLPIDILWGNIPRLMTVGRITRIEFDDQQFQQTAKVYMTNAQWPDGPNGEAIVTVAQSREGLSSSETLTIQLPKEGQ